MSWLGKSNNVLKRLGCLEERIASHHCPHSCQCFPKAKRISLHFLSITVSKYASGAYVPESTSLLLAMKSLSASTLSMKSIRSSINKENCFLISNMRPTSSCKEGYLIFSALLFSANCNKKSKHAS